ncbi:MAG TPA: aldehyde dehydrogenase family protein, partial [Nocardioidaceae bacterium]|nr:aldehyde dehydrogenase family protein [Nocardioidaceae bacterium]
MDARTSVPSPVNEPVLTYAPGSAEREELLRQLAVLQASSIDLPATIGGESRLGSGEPMDVVQPHAHAKVLGTMHNATADDAKAAVAAAKDAAASWRALSYDDRAAVFLKAAELLAGPWRQTLNAATMLGQSKTVGQAEIDAACELIDFWRFNVHFGRQLLEEQPAANSPGIWNRLDHRPLEG